MKTRLLTQAIRLATLATIIAPAPALAGGFALNEQSANAMGAANAGAAANPENATTVLYNPAGMSQLKGTNISFGATYLDISAKAKSGSVSATNQAGQPVSGSTGGDIADPAVLPNFYLTHKVNDSIDVGFAIHAPFGLAADYDDDFVGRFFGDKTELTAVSFSPSIAINNGQGLSMGVGFNVMYAEGTLTKFMDNSGTNAQAPGGPLPNATPQGYADIQGDDIGVTFQVGFLYELNSDTQLGLTARSGTELSLKGDAKFTDVSAVIPAGPQAGKATAIDSTEPVRVPLAIPETITAGVRHQLTDSVTLLAGATYARWSRFESLDIYGRDSSKPLTGKSPGGMPGLLSHTPEKWKDTWQVNIGGIWQATPEWAFKAGYAWDESPVDQYVTARIPSVDRQWLTLGAQWKNVHSGWAVDVAAGTLLFKDDPKAEDKAYVLTPAGTIQNPIDPNSKYQGEYELSAWSAAVQISKAF